MASIAHDAMIRRLEKELEERSSAISGLIGQAQEEKRDLNEAEKTTISGIKDRMATIQAQLAVLEQASTAVYDTQQRMKQIDEALSRNRAREAEGAIEYRSAGAWLLDSYKAATGDRQAAERMDLFYRVAAHQKTSDNLGVIPDPIIGSVINFIDAARPLVSFLGPQNMPSATWHRPLVTQGTSVAVQGSAGAAADEKAELVSQKMTITRLNATAVTYGGYVNVSRQNIDFSSPQILDIIINDLAARYAIQTEAAAAAELASTATAAVTYDGTPEGVAGAIWEAVATVYAATKGQGRLALAVSPAALGIFGPLFAPINPTAAQSTGFTAAQFNQGLMGSIAGVPVIMSSGLTGDQAFLFSTAAIEVYEQRVGTLQATEPSVLGVQVAYAGYFTPLTIEEDAIVPLEAGS